MQLASIPDLMPALPEIVLAVASLALLMLGVFLRGSNIARTISYACIILLIVTLMGIGKTIKALSKTTIYHSNLNL